MKQISIIFLSIIYFFSNSVLCMNEEYSGVATLRQLCAGSIRLNNLDCSVLNQDLKDVVNACKIVRIAKFEENSVHKLDISNDNRYLVARFETLSGTTIFYIWDFDTKSVRKIFYKNNLDNSVLSGAFSRNLKYLSINYIKDNSHFVDVWNLQDPSNIAQITFDRHSAYCVSSNSFSGSDDKYLVISQDKGKIAIADLEINSIFLIKANSKDINFYNVLFNIDSKYILASHKNGFLIWKRRDGKVSYISKAFDYISKKIPRKNYTKSITKFSYDLWHNNNASEEYFKKVYDTFEIYDDKFLVMQVIKNSLRSYARHSRELVDLQSSKFHYDYNGHEEAEYEGDIWHINSSLWISFNPLNLAESFCPIMRVDFNRHAKLISLSISQNKKFLIIIYWELLADTSDKNAVVEIWNTKSKSFINKVNLGNIENIAVSKDSSIIAVSNESSIEVYKLFLD